MLNSTFVKDALERAIWTAAQAFLAVFTVGDMASAKAAGIAAVAAGISVLKSVIATQVGDSSTAATLPRG
jgi:hypothetical protein